MSEFAEIWVVSNFPPPVHGVSVFNESLCAGFQRLGVPYRVFAIGTRGSLEEVEVFGARKLLDDSSQLLRVIASAAKQALRRGRRPLIYFTPSQRGTAALRDAALALIARAFGIPLYGHVHGCGWLNEWRRASGVSGLMLWTLRQCERVICLGPSYAEEMASATGLPCVGVNNGVDVGTGHRTKALPTGTQIELLFLSNLIRSKGLWVAAHAAQVLRERGLEIRLRCAGAWMNAAERAEFELVFRKELADGLIELVGFADKARKRSLLEASHLLLLPTSYPLEGQPLALIEAMAFGVVPITTQQGAIADLFDFDGWQLLARSEHRDAAQVADTIVRLVSDPEEYRATSQHCIAQYERGLTIDRCIDTLLSVICKSR